MVLSDKGALQITVILTIVCSYIILIIHNMYSFKIRK